MSRQTHFRECIVHQDISRTSIINKDSLYIIIGHYGRNYKRVVMWEPNSRKVIIEEEDSVVVLESLWGIVLSLLQLVGRCIIPTPPLVGL